LEAIVSAGGTDVDRFAPLRRLAREVGQLRHPNDLLLGNAQKHAVRVAMEESQAAFVDGAIPGDQARVPAQVNLVDLLCRGKAGEGESEKGEKEVASHGTTSSLFEATWTRQPLFQSADARLLSRGDYSCLRGTLILVINVPFMPAMMRGVGQKGKGRVRKSGTRTLPSTPFAYKDDCWQTLRRYS
jgi:hypothetical protein